MLTKTKYLFQTNKKLSLFSKYYIMDLQARKYLFIQQVFELNENLFEQLETVLKTQLKKTERISIEQYNKELEASINQIEKGKFYTQDEMKTRIKEWTKK